MCRYDTVRLNDAHHSSGKLQVLCYNTVNFGGEILRYLVVGKKANTPMICGTTHDPPDGMRFTRQTSISVNLKVALFKFLFQEVKFYLSTSKCVQHNI